MPRLALEPSGAEEGTGLGIEQGDAAVEITDQQAQLRPPGRRQGQQRLERGPDPLPGQARTAVP